MSGRMVGRTRCATGIADFVELEAGPARRPLGESEISKFFEPQVSNLSGHLTSVVRSTGQREDHDGKLAT